MEFELPTERNSIIKVIGVGGGGGNAVNHMFGLGIRGVDFLICNTDLQALEASPVPNKMQLGPSLTEGRGAGSIPDVGKNAANENIDEIREYLSKDAKMVFITAGMGGGTGTGAAPVIAQIAREMGILTVGIVTVPFNFEGRKRRIQAEEGLEAMRNAVDTLLVINNERLREITGNLSFTDAFAKADDILATAAKGIAEVIEITGAINVDFNDVNTVMKDSGVAIMGNGVAEGESRARKAVEKALESPLLNDNDISGAEYVLLNITYGSKEVMMDEISEITDYIQDAAGSTADVIFGHAKDDTLGEKISVTVIATGFSSSPITGFEREPQKNVNTLEVKKEEFKQPLESPVSNNPWSGAKEITGTQDEPYLVKSNEPAESAPQQTFSFDLPNSTPSQAEGKTVHTLDDELSESFNLEDSQKTAKPLSAEEQQLRNRERLMKIQEYTQKLKKADGLQELESEPAFKRRNIELDESVPSQEDSVSRFSVSKGEDGSFLNSNNSFLHDNVD